MDEYKIIERWKNLQRKDNGKAQLEVFVDLRDWLRMGRIDVIHRLLYAIAPNDFTKTVRASILAGTKSMGETASRRSFIHRIC